MTTSADADADASPPVARLAERRTPLHGSDHVDAYSWITEPDDEHVALLTAERAYYDRRVAGLAPLRERLAEEMRARLPLREVSAPWRASGYDYREVFEVGAQYPALTRTTLGGPDELVIDLQAVSDLEPGGEFYSREAVVSPDGTTLAWSYDRVGKEKYSLCFRTIATATDLPDVVEGTFPTGAWSSDSSTYLYVRTDHRSRECQVWAHVLGTNPSTDRMIFDEPDERFWVSVRATRSGQWLVIRISGHGGWVEELLIPADDVAEPPRSVRPREASIDYRIEHAPTPENDRFLVVTNLGAESFRIMQADVASPGDWTDLYPGDPAVRVYAAEAFRAGFAIVSRRDGVGVVELHPYQGEAFVVRPDHEGGLVALGDNEEFDAAFVTVTQQSFVHPTRHVDVAFDGSAVSTRHVEEIVGVDTDSYVQHRLLAPSPDGTEVPVVVVRRKDVALDGTAPCYLYGYGSYEACTDPDFGYDWWRSLPSLLERGVVVAFGQPRGGGEMGRRWWLDGHVRNKPTTFDDQAAVADFLAAGIVDGSRIVSRGLSAGGLLQGGLYSRRPERFAGIVAEVPFVDVVTTSLDTSLPLTTQEWEEWGNPSDPGDFAVMRSYSPVDNPPPVEARPALLVTGAVHDIRVLVREPTKWVAVLRAGDSAHGGGADAGDPTSRRTVLYRAETGAGAHAGPVGRYSQLDYEAEIFAWCAHAMGLRS